MDFETTKQREVYVKNLRFLKGKQGLPKDQFMRTDAYGVLSRVHKICGKQGVRSWEYCEKVMAFYFSSRGGDSSTDIETELKDHIRLEAYHSHQQFENNTEFDNWIRALDRIANRITKASKSN